MRRERGLIMMMILDVFFFSFPWFEFYFISPCYHQALVCVLTIFLFFTLFDDDNEMRCEKKKNFG
ncbi:hypothetical protein QBC44DRAFT_327899, partial [Cladorrhinum sp. PSN332]